MLFMRIILGSIKELAHNGLARRGQVRRGSLWVGTATRGLCALLLGVSVHAATFGSVLGPGRIKDIIHTASVDVIEQYRVKEVKVQISTSYEEFLTGAVVNLEAPKTQPEQRLEEGLKTFLTGAVEYVRKSAGDIRDRIIRLLPETAGQTYIDSLKQKCRQEMPCPIPPCCGECQRCK